MGGSTSESDTVLQNINLSFIKLQPEEKKYYEMHYRKVLDKVVVAMKCNDQVFNDIFDRLYFAGSVPDGLKICKPEEFDVDVVLNIPISYEDFELRSKRVTPGFIKIKAEEMDSLKYSYNYDDVYKSMDSWRDEDGYLLQSAVRKWMMSVVAKGLNSLQRNNQQLMIDNGQYQILARENGPAITLHVTMPCNRSFDVDLVPVIEFKYPDHWPPQVRRNPFPDIESWFIVPKANAKNPREYRDTFWRLAFHEQEREIIRDMGLLKPVCRLMKKLRDRQGLNKICSYYIKTVMMWEVDNQPEDYWKTETLTRQFLHILKTLQSCLARKELTYYWNKNNNLLDSSGMTDKEMEKVSSSLHKIIQDMERNVQKNPCIFAKYILEENEYESFAGNISQSEVKYLEPQATAMEKDAMWTVINALRDEVTKERKERQRLTSKVQALQDTVKNLKVQLEEHEEELDSKQRGIGHLFSRVRNL